MAQMHTLVLNGQSYTVTDPTAARIDDTQAGEGAWSGQRIVREISTREKSVIDRLCPAFSAKGSTVTCEPVEGYPLEVVSHIAALTQEGSGTPSPDNIRPISGCDSIQLNQNENQFTIDLGQTVYDGTFNWSTGQLTMTSVCRTIEALSSMQTAGYGNIALGQNALPTNYGTTVAWKSSHYNGALFDAKYPNYNIYAGNASGLVIIDRTHMTSLAAANAYLAEQKAAGTPVQIWYKLRTPVTVQLTPQQILSLAGANALSSSAGDTEVSGRADPTVVLQALSQRLDTLEQKEA